MTVITYTRAAKCKDCKFCKPIKKGKLKRNQCANPKSERYGIENGNTIALNDLVCDKWEL